MLRDCKYRLPCNWCDKYDRMCEAVLLELEKEKIKRQEKCEHDWVLWSTIKSGFKNINDTKIYICAKCGKKEIRDN